MEYVTNAHIHKIVYMLLGVRWRRIYYQRRL